jgi:hypothetical protein
MVPANSWIVSYNRIKTEMAAAIVSAFPCLGIKEGDDVKHDHYFHPRAGGFLETRLKTLQNAYHWPIENGKLQAAPNKLLGR